MPNSAMIAIDVVAVLLLVFALYFPRHGRRDMVVALLGINVGVLAVATVLSESTVTAGLGLGLFGVLSIIRLRSSELDQEEVAYYFSALALGLLFGFDVDPEWIAPALGGALLAALFIGDHPRLFGGYRVQVVTLDTAYTDEVELIRALGEMLNAKIHRATIRRVNLVNDTTVVEVRYQVGASPTSTS